MARVLVVEDDPAIAELVRLYLTHDGHAVELIADGAAALLHVEANAAIDLIVLDLMLPGLDGRGLCRRIRAAEASVGRPSLPIIMLTALDDDRDKLEGFDLGADDYLTKPFNPAELVARCRAVLRRVQQTDSPTPGGETIMLGGARLDLAGRRFRVGDQEITLRTKEFDLLVAFATRPGVVLTRDDLLARVWGDEFPGDTRTVDVHVSRLRDKLAAAPLAIETVRSVGYRLVVGNGS
jgi:DNA-binding response OmpR family regulator